MYITTEKKFEPPASFVVRKHYSVTVIYSFIFHVFIYLSIYVSIYDL